MKIRFLIILLLINYITFAQNDNYSAKEIEINKFIEGTLLLPNGIEKPNLIILIAGSGPTDRDGNQNFMKNNSLRKLAEGLSAKQVATFRYDKRIVKQIKNNKIDKNILFNDFVTDAKSVLNYFKALQHYNKIYIAGHSQGSLVGMIAAKNTADGFISIAGAGQSIDNIILEQLKKSMPMFLEDSKRVFKVLETGKTTKDFPPSLFSIFNIELQPFISNWMSYKPENEIKLLKMPILIINGTNDLQVTEAEAKLLKAAAPEAELKIIDKMNHVLVPIEGDRLENSKSYNEAVRPLSTELFTSILEFTK